MPMFWGNPGPPPMAQLVQKGEGLEQISCAGTKQDVEGKYMPGSSVVLIPSLPPRGSGRPGSDQWICTYVGPPAKFPPYRAMQLLWQLLWLSSGSRFSFLHLCKTRVIPWESMKWHQCKTGVRRTTVWAFFSNFTQMCLDFSLPVVQCVPSGAFLRLLQYLLWAKWGCIALL